ncbi:unnamed protein product [Arabidopsis thaliana]|uniref:Uncharacterized protein n=1 Tax=Arabidopsis thaliana TaxID=3702 RepID=A0A654FBU1_ARATH|nr:unnamed protein product [Arabidopsis thaliana]
MFPITIKQRHYVITAQLNPNFKAKLLLGRDGIEALCELYIDGTKEVKPGTQVDSVSGSNRTGVYGSDFGWDKPVNHEIVSIDRYAAFSISERRNEIGGAEIGLVFEEE